MRAETTPTIKRRYESALRQTGPKTAARTLSTTIDGYWLDDERLFFISEQIEDGSGHIVAVPSIANGATGKIDDIIQPTSLAALLSAHIGTPVNASSIALLQYDMPDKDTLAFSFEKHDYCFDISSQAISLSTKTWDIPASYSPDGRFACFVKGSNLWVRDRVTGNERCLTMDGAEHHAYGQSSETFLSALSYRDQPIPVGIWSADSRWFFTHRIDERELPELALVQNAPPDKTRPALHRYKYPLPGDALPVAVYLAIDVERGNVVTFDDVPTEITAFSSALRGRLAGFAGPDCVWFVRFDRYFKSAELIDCNLASGNTRLVIRETVEDGYIDLAVQASTPNVRYLYASKEVIWFSERDGWGHLYLYDSVSGQLKHQITRGTWVVRAIVHVDEQKRRLFFSASGVVDGVDPARRVLCSIGLNGEGFEIVLSHDGDISVTSDGQAAFERNRPHRLPSACLGVSPNGDFVVARYTSVVTGNSARIVDLSTGSCCTLVEASPEEGDPTARQFTALAADGNTLLYGTMFLPSSFSEARSYPLIDFVYPGPQVAMQPQAFADRGSAFARALAELGFITIMLDTRGTPVGSRAFRQASYPALMEPQLSDHAAVVRELQGRASFIDAGRAGIFGISGGGRAAVRALQNYGDVFSVAVAAAGDHDDDRYSALWSDKYRGAQKGREQNEPSNVELAEALTGKLFLIAGDMDQNVHVSQTLMLVDALVRANKDFDLLIVPNAGHSMMADIGYAQRRMWDYFVQHLRAEVPPPEFVVSFEEGETDRVTRAAKLELWRP
jgi:dipeptidyl aminopeptidase/acylaminoacyl peptidase